MSTQGKTANGENPCSFVENSFLNWARIADTSGAKDCKLGIDSRSAVIGA
jgi:hypothetical protein